MMPGCGIFMTDIRRKDMYARLASIDIAVKADKTLMV